VEGIRKRRDLAELEWLKKEVLKGYVRSTISRRKREDLRLARSMNIAITVSDSGVSITNTGEKFRAFGPLNLFSDKDFDWFDGVYGSRLRGIDEFVFSGAVGATRQGPVKRRGQVSNTERDVQRTAAIPKDFERKVPKPIVIEVFINGKPAQALLDSGSMADFISTRLVDQLKLEKRVLAKPLGLQLAVSGSRSKINYEASARFQYQQIDMVKRFDVANLESYDLILGTPWLFQHKVLFGFNPTRISVGSAEGTGISGTDITTISSMATDLFEDNIENFRVMLKQEASDLCRDALETGLPPLRVINHRIPLIDESKIYAWRPSKCPEPLKGLWKEKRQAYIKSGRWRIATGTNAVPMLIIKKPYPGPNREVLLRTVVDKRQINENTKKLVSPLQIWTRF